MIGFGGQFGCWTDNETSMNTTGAPLRRFPWVWMGHREYDPSACRFLTRDPIDYDGGINLYAYAGNNPIMFADPSGFQVHEILPAVSEAEKAAEILRIARLRLAIEAEIAAEAEVEAGLVVGGGGTSFFATVALPATLYVGTTAAVSYFAYQASDTWLAPALANLLFDHGRSAAAALPSAGFAAQYARAKRRAQQDNSQFVTVYHRGNLINGKVVSRSKVFSTSLSKDVLSSVGDLSGPIYTFRIPKAVYSAWDKAGFVGKVHTMMGNKYIQETYFRNGAMELLNQYRVK